MSRKSAYFVVPAAAVAATAGAGSANAAILFQDYDYSTVIPGQSYDVTIGGNATNQYTFSKVSLGLGLIARDDGISGVVNSAGTPTIGLASETYGNSVFTTGQGLNYYHLRFNLNGATTYGYATIDSATTFARVTYEVLPAVPEPATWALAILGFGLAGAALRRRQGALATA